jgi:error-prone DNA polymerase
LPILKPANFYDLAVEVAIIRPGPIHGNAVHPYLARRSGKEPVTYLDERAKPILERTLGVVLFQEQVLSLAMTLGGFSPGEADELRRAIGFTRQPERLEALKAKLRAAMQARAVTEGAVTHIVEALGSFALYGFPESHALSFALLAYASSWLKVHRPAEFYAALLNNQPMGFYGPATLVQDARRHGITVRPVCVLESQAQTTVAADRVLRLGLAQVRGLRAAGVAELVRQRTETRFASLADFLRRTRFTEEERRAFAVPAGPQPGAGLPSLVVRRTAFDRAGEFLDGLNSGEYLEWSDRAAQNGVRIEAVETLCLHRRVHLNNFTRRPESKRDYLRALHAVLSRRRQTAGTNAS